MKTRIRFIILIGLLLTASCTYSQQQPQWKFHIAFEDALGRKDTIFFIWDSSACIFGNDSILGEYPTYIPGTTFQVFVLITNNGQADSCKVVAENIDYGLEKTIYAINYEYPIVLSWDSSLFNSASLPTPVVCAEIDNDYFFYSGNVCQVFNMLETNTVIAPAFGWWSQNQFPMHILILHDTQGCCANSIKENDNANDWIKVHPNPANTNITVENDDGNSLQYVNIYAMDGRCISITENTNYGNVLSIPIGSFEPGVYLIEIHSEPGQKCYRKVIKY